MKKTKKQESGRSMIEMGGVLAIMGLVTAGAFILIQSGLSSQKISRTSDELDILVSNARSMTAQSDSFKSLGTKLDGGKTLAASMLKSDGKSPIGGDYYVYAAGTDYKNLYVGIDGISESDCTTMAARSFSGGTTRCMDNNGKKAFRITYGKQ